MLSTVELVLVSFGIVIGAFIYSGAYQKYLGQSVFGKIVGIIMLVYCLVVLFLLVRKAYTICKHK